MYLLPPIKVEGNTTKVYKDDRGGFGTVARRAKAQTLRKYMSYIMKSQQWMISKTNCSRSGGKHRYTKFTHGKYYNYPVNHPDYDLTMFYVVTLKSNTIQETNVLSNNIDSYFTVDYNKLMMDIILHQKLSRNDTLPPEQLRAFLVNNSKMNNRNFKKLQNNNDNDYNNENDICDEPAFDPFKHNEVDDDKTDSEDNNSEDGNSEDGKSEGKNEGEDDDKMIVASTAVADTTDVVVTTVVADTTDVVVTTDVASTTDVADSTDVAATIVVAASIEFAALTEVAALTDVEASTGIAALTEVPAESNIESPEQTTKNVSFCNMCRLIKIYHLYTDNFF
jgi:hypothetical protein